MFPLKTMEDEIVDDYVDEVGEVEDEVRDVLREMLDVDDDQVPTTLVQQKISSIVTYEGHSIYKSTLVSQLNGNPLLSKDRLTRVRNSIYFNNNDDYLTATSSSTTMLLGLGSDVGVYFKQRTSTMLTSAVKVAQKRTRANLLKEGRPISCVSGGDEGKWMLGRVQKIRRRSGTKWGLSRQPIDLHNKPHVKYGKKGYSQPTLMVLLQWFISAPGRFKFKYEHTDCFWIDVEAIISTVTLSRDPLTKVYEIDHVDGMALDEFVARQT